MGNVLEAPPPPAGDASVGGGGRAPYLYGVAPPPLPVSTPLSTQLFAQFAMTFHVPEIPANVRAVFSKRDALARMSAPERDEWEHLRFSLPWRVLAYTRLELDVLDNNDLALLRWVRDGLPDEAFRRLRLPTIFRQQHGHAVPADNVRAYFSTPRLQPREMEMLRWLYRNVPRSLVNHCWGLPPPPTDNDDPSPHPEDRDGRRILEWLRSPPPPAGIPLPPPATAVVASFVPLGELPVTDACAHGRLTPEAHAFWAAVLRTTPTLLPNRTLRQQWQTFHAPMKRFLADLGLTVTNTSNPLSSLTGTPTIVPERAYALGDDGPPPLQGRDILSLMGAARRFTCVHRSAPDPELVAVAGPVYIVGDEQGAGVAAGNRRPVHCVSIAGLDLTKTSMRKKYVDPTGINTAGEGQILAMWYHALRLFRDAGVRWPVLCAIGCGAFAGGLAGVPETYADALYGALQRHPFAQHFDAVVLALPSQTHFDAFARRLAARLATPDSAKKTVAVPPIVFTRRHGMLSLCAAMQHHLPPPPDGGGGGPVGLLNPSDLEALQQGGMGMFWNGGHIAVEELLAVTTTLLLQHKQVNPRLWQVAPTETNLDE